MNSVGAASGLGLVFVRSNGWAPVILCGIALFSGRPAYAATTTHTFTAVADSFDSNVDYVNARHTHSAVSVTSTEVDITIGSGSSAYHRVFNRDGALGATATELSELWSDVEDYVDSIASNADDMRGLLHGEQSAEDDLVNNLVSNWSAASGYTNGEILDAARIVLSTQIDQYDVVDLEYEFDGGLFDEGIRAQMKFFSDLGSYVEGLNTLGMAPGYPAKMSYTNNGTTCEVVPDSGTKASGNKYYGDTTQTTKAPVVVDENGDYVEGTTMTCGGSSTSSDSGTWDSNADGVPDNGGVLFVPHVLHPTFTGLVDSSDFWQHASDVQGGSILESDYTSFVDGFFAGISSAHPGVIRVELQ